MANDRPNSMLKRRKLVVTAVVAACFGFALGATEWAQADAPTAPALSISTNTAPQQALVALPDFTPIIDRYGPAVVNISSTTNKVIHQQANPFPPNSPFYQFFHHFMAPGQNGSGPQQHEKIQSLGSGFIISPDGYIVTAGHVVRGANHVVVTLTNHHAYPAKLIGLSVRYDTALLKINAKDLPTVPLGNSDDMKVGQWLLAVGAPFGFYNTVTQGVVSAMNRPLPDDEYIPFIQSDVPINPGNSGGPLFNMKGQVVGINDQIYTNSGGYMGLSFSIPINTVMRVVQDFKDHKAIQFGYLGVEVQDVTPPMAQALHLKEPVGALVASVMPGSPAAKAGIKPGDVIVTYDNKPVYNVGQLPPMVGNTLPGTQAKVGILHRGAAETKDVLVTALPKNMAGPSGSQEPAQPAHVGKVSRMGIHVQSLTPNIEKQLNVHHGVVVVGVSEGAAAEAGIMPGMIIQQMDQQDVNSPTELEHIVASLPANQPIPLLVRQGKASIYVVVTLPKK
ncbi:protease Do [Acidithiobacillus ferrivorans SS3]|uniref:Probable periplasmic serine endoprotease DegP-like n=1 Tax=Acidithiobacillus ferrivorans SS3 TaxID=743299 RepID=G0JS17_9PROT|nr:Do family serine endopeptidase [Acidithiobacillus ferrivorans]AEM46525.1 protease Do [Acidithiobacillus ferrivorans SS3]MBU2764720.1 Do family serine endopeptidase [Acidithiobacillus ferrivorans]MBU2850155.1 Do family serine endopeptidase [Acidithiobacillus ferrivorans]OFA14904.1 serine protease [Acidithiobacillus ferrivorans]